MVCLTQEYMDKVNQKKDRMDFCKLEYNFALNEGKEMIVVVMQDALLNPKKWKGSVKLTMGTDIFVDFTRDEFVSTVIDQVAELLA